MLSISMGNEGSPVSSPAPSPANANLTEPSCVRMSRSEWNHCASISVASCRPKRDGERRAQTLALLITIRRVAIFRREVVLRHRRAVVAIREPPAAAVLTAEYVRLELLLVVGHRCHDGQALAELVTEHQRAERLPALAAVGVAQVAGQLRTAQRERAARFQVDDAAETALALRGVRRFVDIDAAEQLGRDAFERIGFADVAFALRVELQAAQEDVVVEQRHVLIQAADAGLGALPVGTIDRDAGQALQRLGHVLVRELADVLGGHRFDDLVGVALVLQRIGQRGAEARDDHFLERLGGRTRRRR